MCIRRRDGGCKCLCRRVAWRKRQCARGGKRNGWAGCKGRIQTYGCRINVVKCVARVAVLIVNFHILHIGELFNRRSQRLGHSVVGSIGLADSL